jgi:hypothetical protein
VEIKIEKIDPDRARELLAKNHNRNIRTQHVAKLARAMMAGDWRPGSVISFASMQEDDVLIDGQHRLRAVVQADVTIEFIVIYGRDIEDQQTLDTGIARTLSDTLTLSGEVNANSLAAAINWHWRRVRKYYHDGHTPTIPEGMRVLEEHPGLRLSIQPTRHACRLLKFSHGLAACLHYEMTGIDPDSAEEFWTLLDTGLHLHERHPIYWLRVRLENNAVAISKIDTSMIHALTIKAWNAYMKGSDVAQLRWIRGGAKPEPFPELEDGQDQ